METDYLTQVTLANGIELAVWDSGPKDAPVLIFLHGFPENHRSWRHQIRKLNQSYRCIAPDQRGYGGSSKPQEVAEYTTDKLIGDVFLLADALGVGQFTIVGHDWGGAIAWPVAMMGEAQNRVNRAIIANAPHVGLFQQLLYTDPVQRKASQYMRTFRDTSHDALIREHGLAAFLQMALPRGEGANPFAALEPEELQFMFQGWQDRDACFGMLNWYRASAIDVPAEDAPFALPEGFAPPPLPKLTIPTLVIWALDDTALPPCNLEGLEGLVEDLTVVKVPDCGHFVQWTKPAEVTVAMEEFLNRTKG